jgi:hypothetical protein
MTGRHTSAFSRHGFVRGLQINSAPKRRGRTRPSREGAGKTGCALHPRSRAQEMHASGAHEHTGEAEAIRPSLRNGFTAYTRSPWWPCCATITGMMRSIIADLTPALVRQDHTISPYAACRPSTRTRHVAALPRPPHPAPDVRDGHEAPLLGARDGNKYAGDLRRKNTDLFFQERMDSQAKSPAH